MKEHEAGVSVADLCRKHGVSDASIYKWKAKFGGMEVSEAKRLKALEDENTRLKRLLADAMLDNAAGLTPSKPISPKSSALTNASITRTGLLSSMKSSRHSGNNVHCPRSASSSKRFSTLKNSDSGV